MSNIILGQWGIVPRAISPAVQSVQSCRTFWHSFFWNIWTFIQCISKQFQETIVNSIDYKSEEKFVSKGGAKSSQKAMQAKEERVDGDLLVAALVNDRHDNNSC